MDALRDRLPDDAREILEEHLGATGFALRELAAFGVAIEGLLHGESNTRLGHVRGAVEYKDPVLSSHRVIIYSALACRASSWVQLHSAQRADCEQSQQ